MADSEFIFSNATVLTLGRRRLDAEAIAVQNGRIVAVGTNKEIRNYVTQNTKVVDCRGKTIVPGLVDCHTHMVEFGFFLQELDLRNARSIEEIQQRLREYAAKNIDQNWILGGRWDQEKLSEKRYPTRWDLDEAVNDRPVYLTRVCGHLAVANSKALRLAQITKRTKVKAGSIDLDKCRDLPNGVVRENAMNLIWKVVPKPTQERLENACLLACTRSVETGLTEVHWLVSSAEEVRILQKMYADGRLPIRVYLGVPVEALDEITHLGLQTGFGNDMIRLGFIKILADGSLGARTAALQKSYSDNPGKRGMMLYSEKELCQLVLEAHRAGLQLGVHAIGDRAIKQVLDAIKKALKESPRKNHRHRIEHCSVMNANLLSCMKQLGIVASVQPHFVISDFWAINRLGRERARWTHPFKTLLKEGIIVASGSDCPIEKINPLLGIWAAVSRKDNVKERLTVEEAFRTYTVNAAYASFDEERKGTIEVGKFADLTVLSDDPRKIAPDKIREVAVEMVIVNGKIVYSKKTNP